MLTFHTPPTPTNTNPEAIVTQNQKTHPKQMGLLATLLVTLLSTLPTQETFAQLKTPPGRTGSRVDELTRSFLIEADASFGPRFSTITNNWSKVAQIENQFQNAKNTKFTVDFKALKQADTLGLDSASIAKKVTPLTRSQRAKDNGYRPRSLDPAYRMDIRVRFPDDHVLSPLHGGLFVTTGPFATTNRRGLNVGLQHRHRTGDKSYVQGSADLDINLGGRKIGAPLVNKVFPKLDTPLDDVTIDTQGGFLYGKLGLKWVKELSTVLQTYLGATGSFRGGKGPKIPEYGIQGGVKLNLY